MILYIERLAIEACSTPSQELPMKKALEHYTKGILYCNHTVMVCILEFFIIQHCTSTTTPSILWYTQDGSVPEIQEIIITS